MQYFNHHDFKGMPPRYRAQLVNSLSGFKSANLIGSVNVQGQTNLAIFSSVVHLGADPALIGFIMRPDTVPRDTLENIRQTEQYTINQVNIEIWQAAHQTAARYPQNQCEFVETGLTKEFVGTIRAPFVAESQLKYALELKQIVPIELNGTALVIGQITDLICQQDAIAEDGYIDIEQLQTVALSGLDSYHQSDRLARLSYSKPGSKPVKL